MMDYKEHFKDKKVTVMGLGLLGGALNDALFLAECGAKLTITDLKSKEELQPSLEKLSQFKDIKFVLGKHDLEDFKNQDFVLQPGNVPLDSIFLREARKNNIPIYVSESLFAQYSESTLIGITGTRGKSTVTHMLFDILSKVSFKDKKVFLGGNVKNVSTLSLLKEAHKGDLVVLELDSWALAGMGDIKKSPHISIFTTFFDDHLNFYKGDKNSYLKDKTNIFKYQNTDDVLILGSQVEKLLIEKYGKDIQSRIITARMENVPQEWKLKILGEHNIYNASCVIEACRTLGVSEEVIEWGVMNFKGISGRLEFVKEVRGVKIYNDTTSTTPEATVVALNALGKDKNIILILGGADKTLDMSKLIEVIPKYCKKVVLLPGTGTDKLKASIFELSGQKNLTAKSQQLKADVADSLKDAIDKSLVGAIKGDVILFSPAFASFGMFINEFDRGDRFLEIVNKL